MKTAADLTRTVLESELISHELMAHLISSTGRFFVMDDLTNGMSLFAERPPGTDYWWYSVDTGWHLVSQPNELGVNEQFAIIGMTEHAG